MVKDRHERPLYDLLLQVANPALIIAMVAALIFFLIEIFYRGPHVFRLNLIMTLFTSATVLTSRISIEAGKERAALFAVGLAIATLATTSVIVEFEYQQFAILEPVVIVLLIATVMWVSNRLVWDCTLLGRTRDVSAMGLVEVLRQKFVGGGDTEVTSKDPKKTQRSVFSVFEFMLGRNGKNTTPGLWGFYLALAAFPIFGFGQWFVSPNTSGFSIFFLFAVYLTSGLGLLMVTSLLGLKRYVNKRGITIPDAIALNWLFVGTVFLLGLLLLISFLPRPDLSSTMNDYLVLLGNAKETAELAIGDDNEIADQPNADPKPNAKPKRNQANQPNADAPQADGNRGDHADPNSSEKMKGGGKEKSNHRDRKDSKSDANGPKNDGDQNKGDAKNRDVDPPKKTQKNGDANAPLHQNPNEKGAEDVADKKPDADNNPGNQRQQRVAPPPPPLMPDENSFRWIIYVLVALLFLVLAVMYRDEILKWWRSLFVTGKSEDEDEAPNTAAHPMKPAKPFSHFRDPFSSGKAQNWSPERLMEYSFEAMRAWGTEHGVDTTVNLTSEELVQAVLQSDATADVESKVLKTFSAIFNQTIYGRVVPNQDQLQSVQRLWQLMKHNTQTVSR